MCNVQTFNITVILQEMASTTAELEQLFYGLTSELHELGIEASGKKEIVTSPQGTKGVDPVLLGTVIIAVTPILLAKCLEFLHSWAMRRENKTITIEIQAKDKSIKVQVPATMSKKEVTRWIEAINDELSPIKKRGST